MISKAIEGMEVLYGQEISLFGHDAGDVSERGKEGERGGHGRAAAGVAGDAQRGRGAPEKEPGASAGKVEEPLYVKDTFLKEPSKRDDVAFKQADLPFGKPGQGDTASKTKVSGSPRSVVMRTTGRIDAEGNNVSSAADAAALLSFVKSSPPT